jgi:hypothetical protein
MAAIVHLVGEPGVGKLTVARAVAASRAEDAPDRIVVIDNHLTGNPILSVLDIDRPIPARAWALIGEVRRPVHDAIAELSPPGWMFVFTNVIQVDDPMGDVTIGALVELAVRRGVPYVPVVLHCDQSEHRRRIVAPGRSDRRKWTDVDAKRRRRRSWRTWRPSPPDRPPDPQVRGRAEVEGAGQLTGACSPKASGSAAAIQSKSG